MNEDLLRLLQDVTDSQTRQAAIDLFNSVSQGGRNVEQALLAVRRTYVDIVAPVSYTHLTLPTIYSV